MQRLRTNPRPIFLSWNSTLFLEDRFERSERNLSNKKRIITRYLENQKFSHGEKRIYTRANYPLIFRPIDRFRVSQIFFRNINCNKLLR